MRLFTVSGESEESGNFADWFEKILLKKTNNVQTI